MGSRRAPTISDNKCLHEVVYLFPHLEPCYVISQQIYVNHIIETLKMQFEQIKHHKPHTKIEALNNAKKDVKNLKIQTTRREFEMQQILLSMTSPQNERPSSKIRCCFEKCGMIT